MNILSKFLVAREIKKYSNTYLKQSYLTYLRANTLTDSQKDCKKLIINEMKRRGLL